MSGQRPVLIAPSILAADFTVLGDQVRAAVAAGADWIHIDVMDGHFVPNISIGLPIVAAVRTVTTVPLDVHLMIERPERYITAFAAAGADRLTVHLEACPQLHAVVEAMRAAGVQPGVAINPATPLILLDEIMAEVDLILIMSVNPGFGGQRFLPASLRRIAALRAQLNARQLTPRLEVDGGLNASNAGAVAAAGADVLVAGSALFSPTQPVATTMAALRAALPLAPALPQSQPVPASVSGGRPA